MRHFLGLRGHNLDMFPIGIHQRESMLKTGFIFGRPFEQFKNSWTWQGSPPRNSVAKVICDGEASTYCLLVSRSGPWGHITMRSGYIRVYCSSGTFQNLGGVPNGLRFFLRTPFNQFFKFFIWFCIRLRSIRLPRSSGSNRNWSGKLSCCGVWRPGHLLERLRRLKV